VIPTPVDFNPESTSTPNAAPATSTHYALDVTVDYSAHTLEVQEIIDYTNNTGGPLAVLPLIVPPLHDPNVFLLSGISIDRQSTSAFTLDSGLIQMALDPPLLEEEGISLQVSYLLQLPNSRGPLGYTNRQMLVADWFPFIPLYHEDQGWLIHPPGLVGEYLIYPLSRFNVQLSFPGGLNGLVVAASAPYQQIDVDTLVIETAARNMSFAISPKYIVAEQTIGNVTIQSYTFPEHTFLGGRAVDLAHDAWNSFTKLYGSNQRNFLSIVEAEFHDGLEYDGLFFLSDGYFTRADQSPKNYFTLLVIHETAHQWFYGYVSNDPAREPWLDEALCT
jgi:hypothetical protein